jgi:acetyl esterase/lipase
VVRQPPDARRTTLSTVQALVLAATLILAQALLTLSPAPARAEPSATLGQFKVKVVHDIRYDHDISTLLDIYQPIGAGSSRPIVELIHGGGWVAGDKSRLQESGRYLASHGFLALALDYTLATPVDPGLPKQVNEIKHSVTWLDHHAAHYDGNPKLIAMLGGSAGGTLAALAGLELDNSMPGTIRAVVSLSGGMNFPLIAKTFHQDESCGKHGACIHLPDQTHIPIFLGCRSMLSCPQPLLKRGSPIEHVTTASPPFLLFNSTHELAPLTQLTTMAATLRADSVPVKTTVFNGTGHAGAYEQQAAPEILSYLQRTLVPGGLTAPPSTPTATQTPTSTSTPSTVVTVTHHSHSGRRGVLAVLAIVAAVAIYFVIESSRRRRRQRRAMAAEQGEPDRYYS